MKWFAGADKIINLDKVLFIELGMIQDPSHGWVPGIKCYFSHDHFTAISYGDREVQNIAACFDNLKRRLVNDTMGDTAKNDQRVEQKRALDSVEQKA